MEFFLQTSVTTGLGAFKSYGKNIPSSPPLLDYVPFLDSKIQRNRIMRFGEIFSDISAQRIDMTNIKQLMSSQYWFGQRRGIRAAHQAVLSFETRRHRAREGKVASQNIY